MGRTVWYPGHMAKGRRQLDALAGALDILIEVRDARAPRLSASPFVDEGASSRLKIWTVLSKADLAETAATDAWLSAMRDEGRRVWALDTRKPLPDSFKRALASSRPSSSAKKNYRPVRLAVAGIPNVGKSMLLNRIVGAKRAVVGGIPGVTKGVSWFAGDGVLAADSPGILDPHEDARVHRMLTWISSTKGAVIGTWSGHASECIEFLQRRGKAGLIETAWGVEASGEPSDVIERIGRRLGKLQSGGAVDTEAAARMFIDALSEGRLGRMTLELPGETEPWTELA